MMEQLVNGNMYGRSYRKNATLLIVLAILLLSACSSNPAPGTDHSTAHDLTPTTEAALTAISLAADERLQVAATTSIVGDIVAQIGGDHIALFTLIPPGIDPHSYTPTPQDLRTLADTHIIFVNGLHLEEGLADLLAEAAAPQVIVNRDVELLRAEEHEGEDEDSHDAHAAEEHADDEHEAEEVGHEHGEYDPHTWQSIANVRRWLPVIQETLSTLDPTNRAAYEEAARDYDATLAALDDELHTQINTIPTMQRKLVTDHESFNYFAHDYEFTVVGAIIPSLSSLAESSAQELAALQDQITTEEVSAIFVGVTANPNLAEQLANDLGIAVVPLYSDALSNQDGPAASYVDFMRYNVNAIVQALVTE